MRGNPVNVNTLQDTWKSFQKKHKISVDRMLCNPALRNEFLGSARKAVDCDDEFQILWKVVGLRKGKALPAVFKS